MKVDEHPSLFLWQKSTFRRLETVPPNVYRPLSAATGRHEDRHGGHCTMSRFLALVALRRDALRNRFRGPSQWRRLLCLGIILIDFAIIGITASLYQLSLIAYQAGTTAVLGGTALAIIIFRITRPSFALDWILIGAILVGIGLTLMRDPPMSSLTAFVAFSALMISLSLILIWIGVTTSSVGGRTWVSAGGFTALLCASVSIVAQLITPALPPDTVASVILLLTGMSVFGLALSLRWEGQVQAG